jgi:hypothetical protein
MRSCHSHHRRRPSSRWDWSSQNPNLPPPPSLCVRLGTLIELETVWKPMGHGLGEVLYSLPLAPCESVKLAIIDWARQDETSRTEDLSVAEQLLHNQRRDRAIEEVARGVVSEWQRGGTVMGAVGGSYSASNLSIAASLGASYSTSAGDRNAVRLRSPQPARRSRRALRRAHADGRIRRITLARIPGR